MDETTRQVREMYEQFPYPSGNPVSRVGNDVELALGYQGRDPGRRGPRQVLDAGCGRGIGIIGAAVLQPEVRFLGADLNRVALTEAAEAVAQRGLSNVRFCETDLMTLDGLEVPEGGFDVIHSSGVVHHLSDPAAGLTRLREVLAPHGVINFMVYARHGRRPLMNVAEAARILAPDDRPLSARILPARTVAALASHHVLQGTSFAGTYEVDDVELVDRLLNVNETSYDVPALWRLLDAAGLRFLRWTEPADWTPSNLMPTGHLQAWLDELPEVDRYRFIELVFRRPKLELLACRADNGPRAPLAADGIEAARFAVNPELVITTGVRLTPAGQRTEALSFVLRTRDPVELGRGPLATVLLALRDRVGASDGRTLLRDIRKLGLDENDARAAILELERQEILYRPY